MKFTFNKDIILLLAVMVLFAGCATKKPENSLRGRLVAEIYPAFKAFDLPFYVYYTADKFESEGMPEIKKCIMSEDGVFEIISVNSSGGEKYLIVNRFGRIIGEKGFAANSKTIPGSKQ